MFPCPVQRCCLLPNDIIFITYETVCMSSYADTREVHNRTMGMQAQWGGIRHSRVLLHLAVSSLGILYCCLFVTLQCMSPSATWQEPHCDLLWTNDSAKCIVCHSQWIKLDSCCQIIQLCVTQYYFRDVWLYFFFFTFSIGRKTFCNGIFNIQSSLVK